MGNLLSVHISSGRRDGFGDWLQALAKQGNKPPIIYSVNENVDATLQQYSPNSKWIYRYQSDVFNRLPSDMWQGDPRANARNWLTGLRQNNLTLVENWALNPADWHDPLNEPVPGTPAQAQWLNDWMLEALEISHQRSFKLALFSFATGSPQYDLWQYLIPALRLGKQYDAVLSIHGYNDNGLNERGPSGAPSEAALHNAFRHRQIYPTLPAEARLMIFYSEASAGNGYNTGMSGQRWVDDLIGYAQRLIDDGNPWDQYVASICAYQLGGSESNCYTALPAYSASINAQDWTITAPDPEPPPNAEYGSGEFAGAGTLLIDAERNVWDLGLEKQEAGYPVLKNGLQHGGGFGMALLYYNQVIYVTNSFAEWYAATEMGWQKVSGDPRLIVTTPPPAGVNLAVPWVGQNTGLTTDDYSNSDCGPASVCMWLRFRGNQTVTVDDVSRATGKTAGYTYTVFADLDRAANFYGLNLKHELGTLTLSKILAELDAGRPVMPLVHYPSLPVRFDPNYAFSHWIVLKGYTDTGFIYHDPYWPDTRGQNIPITTAQLTTALQNVTLNDNAANQGAIEETTVTPPAPATHPPAVSYTSFGIGAGTQSEITQQQADIYGRGFTADQHAAFKFLTLPDGGLMTNSITKIKAKNPNAFLMARLFCSFANTPVSPQNFVDYCHNGTAAAYANGVRHFEISNEPNLSSEGLGVSWPNGLGFGNWLKGVLDILMPHYPDARWWFPGLSPNDAAPQFIIDALSTGVGARLHGYCVHSYFTSASGGAYPLNTEAGGLSWLKLWRVMPDSERIKPIALTEFSNNSASVAPGEKGRQYKQYREVLRQNGVTAAFSFVLNWSDDPNKENWINNTGGSTGIVEGYIT